MAALLDPGSPGDAQQPDPALMQAYGSGYSYGEVANYHDANGMDAPPRPDLTDIWSGISPEGANWSTPDETGKGQGAEGLVRDVVNTSPDELAGMAGVGGVANIEAKGAAALAENLLPKLFHGSDTVLTTDMMQAGRSLWVSDNPGVAKNLGNVLHDVTLRPGEAVDVTEEALKQAGNRDPQAVQRALYDISYNRQLTSPDIKYLQADVPGSGTVRIVQNQRRDVLDIAARKR